jgi:hypothetical protein
MMRPSGILVVNRLELMRTASRSSVLPQRAPALSLPPADVFLRYRGLDGAPWPGPEHLPFDTEDGLAGLADWPEVKTYLDGLPCRDECDVVVLACQPTDTDRVPDSEWVSAGIDVGYFESEYSRFSVILNEVIFGAHDELRRFGDRLNEHLLLPSLNDARELLSERGRLRSGGADLEHEPPFMEPITVFIRRSTCPVGS